MSVRGNMAAGGGQPGSHSHLSKFSLINLQSKKSLHQLIQAKNSEKSLKIFSLKREI